MGKYSCLLLAISKGYVIVGKEIMINVDKEVFELALARFLRIHTNDTVTFLSEDELVSLLRLFTDKRIELSK